MHLLEKLRGYEFEAVVEEWVMAQRKDLQRNWARLQKRTNDADTESNIDGLAAVLPDYHTELRPVIAIQKALKIGCSARMLDTTVNSKPSHAGPLVAEMEVCVSVCAYYECTAPLHVTFARRWGGGAGALPHCLTLSKSPPMTHADYALQHHSAHGSS